MDTIISNMCAGFSKAADNSESKKKFLQDCDLAFGAFKLSCWSGVNQDHAVQLLTRYWSFAELEDVHGTSLTMDECVNALTILLGNNFPESLLAMPEKSYFNLVTEVALDNMNDIVRSEWDE